MPERHIGEVCGGDETLQRLLGGGEIIQRRGGDQSRRFTCHSRQRGPVINISHEFICSPGIGMELSTAVGGQGMVDRVRQ